MKERFILEKGLQFRRKKKGIRNPHTEEVSYLVCSCPPLKRYRDLFRKLPLKALKIVKEV